MNQPPITFKSIQILYLAMLVGQVLIGLVMGFQIREMETGELKILPQHGIIALVVLAGVAIGSFLLYRKRAEQGAALKGFTTKLEHYRLSNILRWALLEGANLLVIMLAFLNQNWKMLWLFAIGVAVFLLARPSKEGFVSDYQLTSQEQAELG